MSYAGPGALERARLARRSLRARLQARGDVRREIRFDLIGVTRCTVRALSATKLRRMKSGSVSRRERTAWPMPFASANEVETLYTNGPAGGGGATKSAREVLSLLSMLLSRDLRAMRRSSWRCHEAAHVAHSRSGDKGDIIEHLGHCVRPRRLRHAARHVTADRVKEHFAGIVLGDVKRYELPRIGALNFVMHGTRWAAA